MKKGQKVILVLAIILSAVAFLGAVFCDSLWIDVMLNYDPTAEGFEGLGTGIGVALGLVFSLIYAPFGLLAFGFSLGGFFSLKKSMLALTKEDICFVSHKKAKITQFILVFINILMMLATAILAAVCYGMVK